MARHSMRPKTQPTGFPRAREGSVENFHRRRNRASQIKPKVLIFPRKADAKSCASQALAGVGPDPRAHSLHCL